MRIPVGLVGFEKSRMEQRYTELLRLGFVSLIAAIIAHDFDVEIEKIDKWIAGGCTPELAANLIYL